MTATGTFSDSNGVHGTWRLTHVADVPSLIVSIGVPRLSAAEREPNGVIPNVIEGADGVLTVTVTARAGDFKDVFFRGGGVRTTCGGTFVKIFASPPEAFGFPLAKGATRRFTVKFLGLRWGSGTAELSVRGVTSGGATVDSSAVEVIEVGPNDARRRGGPIVETSAHRCTGAHSP